MKWDAWGDPEAAKPLSDGIRNLLKQALGVGDASLPELELDEVRLRPSALSPADRDALAEIVGDRALRRRRRPRQAAACGRQVHAGPACAARDPGVQDAPDAVLLPGDEDEIAAILRYVRGSAASPSSRSAAAPAWSAASIRLRGEFKAVISLDLRRLERTALARRGLRRGRTRRGRHRPGGRTPARRTRLLARPLPAELPVRDDRRIRRDPLVRARTRRATAGSTTWSAACARSPRRACSTSAGHPESAAGPDLRQLMVGSEGVFGVITRVRVRVHPVPETTRYEAWSFPDFATGADALRAVVQTGTGPTVIRLSDEAETGVNLATTESIGEEQHHRRLPGDHRVRGHRGTRREPARRDPRGAGGPRRHVAGRGARAGMGARPLQRAVPARLAAVGGRVVRDARDRHQLVQHRRAESRRDRGADHRAGRNRHAGAWCCATFRMCIPPARRCTSPSSPGSAAIRSSSGARRRPPRRTR